MFSNKSVYLSVLSLAFGLGASGCSGDDSTARTDSTVCEDLPPLELKDTYKVGFAQLWEDHGPWRDANTASMKDEAEKRGFELMFDPGTKSDPAEQVARMQAL